MALNRSHVVFIIHEDDYGVQVRNFLARQPTLCENDDFVALLKVPRRWAVETDITLAAFSDIAYVCQNTPFEDS